MSKVLIVAAAVACATLLQAQTISYAKGDIVQLVAPAAGDPLPDSRIIAVAGAGIHIAKTGVIVNGERVAEVSREMLDQFAETWDQVVPVGHYFVIGERQAASSTVRYHGLIPAAKIVRKVNT